MRWLFSLLALALFGAVQAVSSTGNRVLVVLDDLAQKESYTFFWNVLSNRGLVVDFKTPKTTDLSLFRLGALAYDHLILLPSKSKGLGPNLSPNLLVDYIKQNGNILLTLTGDGSIPSSIASFLLEFDITLPPERNSVVVDHFNFEKSGGDKHDVLRFESVRQTKTGVKDLFKIDRPLIVPHAVGQVLGNSNPLLNSILKAPSTAYAYNPKENESLDDVFATGAQLSLVTAFQARNSARLTVLGAAELLEDKWTLGQVKDAQGKEVSTANAEFAEQLVAWTTQETGVVKVGRVTHYLNEQSSKTTNGTEIGGLEINPVGYRIKNDVTYSIELSEWHGGHYDPFELPAGDEIQLEFSMLSPFHRLTLKETGRTTNSTIFSTSFKLPDQHGIFNFLVNYKRPFLTNIFEKRTVTVRHFAHDEWPRSFVITGAHPWIAGIAVTVAGWLVFVAVWLYSKPNETSAKKTQ